MTVVRIGDTVRFVPIGYKRKRKTGRVCGIDGGVAHIRVPGPRIGKRTYSECYTASLLDVDVVA